MQQQLKKEFKPYEQYNTAHEILPFSAQLCPKTPGTENSRDEGEGGASHWVGSAERMIQVFLKHPLENVFHFSKKTGPSELLHALIAVDDGGA